jgi:hypothetical protein
MTLEISDGTKYYLNNQYKTGHIYYRRHKSFQNRILLETS